MTAELTGTSSTFYLDANWTTADTNSLSYVDYNWITNWPSWMYPCYHYHYCGCNEYKVRLTLKEIDVLRRAAKKDERLRDVLEKLTPKIEVEVKF